MHLRLLRWLMPCLLFWLTACGTGDHPLNQQADMAPLAAPAHWSVFLLAGDNSIPVFDNAVERFHGLLQGPSIAGIRSFSADDSKVADSDLATVDNLASAMEQAAPSADTGCFVFVTSHGNRDGVFLRADLAHQHFLTPTRLGQMLDATCGQRPTVAIISACHSGIFLDDAAPNRIILTAARADRTSFGCGAGFEFTYYDSCLLDDWPRSHDFNELYDAVTLCVREKERQMNVTPSEPQASFGAAVASLALP